MIDLDILSTRLSQAHHGEALLDVFIALAFFKPDGAVIAAKASRKRDRVIYTYAYNYAHNGGRYTHGTSTAARVSYSLDNALRLFKRHFPHLTASMTVDTDRNSVTLWRDSRCVYHCDHATMALALCQAMVQAKILGEDAE